MNMRGSTYVRSRATGSFKTRRSIKYVETARIQECHQSHLSGHFLTLLWRHVSCGCRENTGVEDTRMQEQKMYNIIKVISAAENDQKKACQNGGRAWNLGSKKMLIPNSMHISVRFSNSCSVNHGSGSVHQDLTLVLQSDHWCHIDHICCTRCPWISPQTQTHISVRFIVSR
jgi:hypothetical protein